MVVKTVSKMIVSAEKLSFALESVIKISFLQEVISKTEISKEEIAKKYIICCLIFMKINSDCKNKDKTGVTNLINLFAIFFYFNCAYEIATLSSQTFHSI